MASKSRRLYTGVTNNIERRVAQHKAGQIKGFTQQYKINRVVYYEQLQFVNCRGRTANPLKPRSDPAPKRANNYAGTSRKASSRDSAPRIIEVRI
jgi:hypothetical protein